jgi:hypothetical protein
VFELDINMGKVVQKRDKNLQRRRDEQARGG